MLASAVRHAPPPDRSVIFHPLEIDGVFLLEPEGADDRRGFFARTYCRHELEARGLEPTVVRTQVSVHRERGTVHGLHWQAPPGEAVLIRCTRGAIHVVALDLRPGSPSFRRHAEAPLDVRSRCSLYLPAGVAHGFQTLEDGAEVFLQTSELPSPEQARGVRWNDPAFEIAWPLEVAAIAERDLSFPDFGP